MLKTGVSLQKLYLCQQKSYQLFIRSTPHKIACKGVNVVSLKGVYMQLTPEYAQQQSAAEFIHLDFQILFFYTHISTLRLNRCYDIPQTKD